MKGAKELAESNKAFILRVRTAHAKLSGDKHELEHDDIDACPLWYDGCNCVKAVLSWLPGLADRLEHADNRLAAIDSAVPGDVAAIASRCEAGLAGDNILQAVQDIKALLAIAQKQAADIAAANASILKLRAEVEEMRGRAEDAEHETRALKALCDGLTNRVQAAEQELARIKGPGSPTARMTRLINELSSMLGIDVSLHGSPPETTLLDAVRVLTDELADLRRRPAESRALRLESELDAARSEIDRLKADRSFVCERCEDEEQHGDTMNELRAEIEQLRESNRQLAENAQLATDSLLRRTQELLASEEREREQAAVAMGVQPVVQPSEKVGELPVPTPPPGDDIEAAKSRVSELEEQMRALGDDRGWRWDSLDGNREEAQADLDHLIAERALCSTGPYADQSARPAEELPAWLRELERLQLMACDKDQIDLRHTLAELANLRRVILSGKGEAVIPDEVARYLVCVSDSTDPPSPAGVYIGAGDSWNYKGTWEHAPGGVTEGADRILSAIDAYGNTLITP